MSAILNLKSTVVLLILCVLVALGVLGAGSVRGSGKGREATDVDMMKNLANSPGAFVFVDLESMRADADLEDTYDALERDVEVWISPLDMDFDEVDRMGVGGKVAAFEGLFSLDQLRCKLKANGFVKTKYRGVEVWEKDSQGEIITCPDGGIFSWLSCAECESPFTGPCFESDSDEEQVATDADDDCGYVDAVALMSTRGTFSRGHETVLSGGRDWVRDSIGVIRYGDASIYDDREFGSIVNMLPRGLVVKYQKQRFLDLYEYEGVEVSGVSVDKKSDDTLCFDGVCRFADAGLAATAAENIQSDLENDAFGRWNNVAARRDGECVRVTFEADIARSAVVDVAPPCITQVLVAGITMNNAVVAWLTNEPATGRVDYGETEAYESTPAVHSSFTTSHAFSLTGLSRDTEYHFRVVSVDSSGNEAASTEFGFRTLGDLPPDSYSIIDDNGQAALRIYLARLALVPTTTMELSLTGPNGATVGFDSVGPLDTEAVLHMADHGVTPKAGTYILSFADASGKQIVWSEFTFSGADGSVSQVVLDWEYVAYAGRYTLYGMSFNLQNTGDLPMYIDEAQVTIGTLVFKTHIGEIVLPGTEKTIYKPTYITGIAPGSKKFVLRLMDEVDEAFYTCSSTVTPS